MRAPARTAKAYREIARTSRLRYVVRREQGIRRRRNGTGFRYVASPDIDVGQCLPRIRALAIPPAWTDVWISTDPRSHLQATGRDARDRLQYRYHAHWTAACAQAKYRRTLLAGQRLARIRRTVRSDLRRPGLPRRKVVAAVVRLLERSLIRVGNDEYARQNRSFGLTMLQNRHLRPAPAGKIALRFNGKGNVTHQLSLRAPRIARVVDACRRRPGRDLFKFEDRRGSIRDITARHVNAYLAAAAAADVSAKDFRTWAATVLMYGALLRYGPAATAGERKRNVRSTLADVAARLNNTAAVCRRSYVHPRIAELYLNGRLPLRRCRGPEFGRLGLSPLERATLDVLAAKTR